MTQDVIKIIDAISTAGIPIIICAIVIYFCVKYLPRYIENRAKDNNEQMKVIITIAQQQIETQKRSNEVIERNNLIIQSSQQSNEKLVTVIDALIDRYDITSDDIRQLSNLSNSTHTELVRISEKISNMN